MTNPTGFFFVLLLTRSLVHVRDCARVCARGEGKAGREIRKGEAEKQKKKLTHGLQNRGLAPADRRSLRDLVNLLLLFFFLKRTIHSIKPMFINGLIDCRLLLACLRVCGERWELPSLTLAWPICSPAQPSPAQPSLAKPSLAKPTTAVTQPKSGEGNPTLSFFSFSSASGAFD